MEPTAAPLSLCWQGFGKDRLFHSGPSWAAKHKHFSQLSGEKALQGADAGYLQQGTHTYRAGLCLSFGQSNTPENPRGQPQTFLISPGMRREGDARAPEPRKRNPQAQLCLLPLRHARGFASQQSVRRKPAAQGGNERDAQGTGTATGRGLAAVCTAV